MVKNHRTKDKDGLLEYIKVALSSSGFKKSDYDLRNSTLYFKIQMDRVKKDKITATLSQAFPQYSFVWESNHLLTWF